eukprot:CAMPEP_0178403032 /NCGR_PEP_ID=MMETSP0689_2-20121128/17158_1 /TAXON_ID=160604 /ORGANISM="Amphidinium massartii, Strain CS-259" /LENGTH=250 /DNA_ID=CAMNT_0020023971 /DNA_START=164 /DNA_END=913 /DNA_ORIENTATION=+
MEEDPLAKLPVVSLEPETPGPSQTQEMLQRLDDCGRAMLLVTQEEGSRVRDAEEKVRAAAVDLMELKRAQEQELKHLKMQCEKQYRDSVLSCQQRLHKADHEKAEAAGRLDAAQRECKSAEASVASLKSKVADLRMLLQRRQEASEQNLQRLERTMDWRKQALGKQTERRINGMAEHAKEVVNLASSVVEERRALVQAHLTRSHLRAEGRVRFKELCQLARAWHEHKLTAPQYRELKTELVDLWHLQKAS